MRGINTLHASFEKGYYQRCKINDYQVEKRGTNGKFINTPDRISECWKIISREAIMEILS